VSPEAALALDIPGPNARNVISTPPPPPAPRAPTPPPGVELVRALIAAQKMAQAVAKDAVNTHHKYNYASAEAILTEAREALTANGLAVMPVSVDCDERQRDHIWETGKDDKGEPTSWINTPRRIRAVYLLMHESGQCREFESTVPVIPERGRPEDKAEFGARTENLAYALRDLLLLPRGGENAPSARDDTGGPDPRDQGRGKSNGNGKKAPPKEAPPPAARAEQPATQNGPRPGTAERALRITNILTGPKDQECLGMPKPAAFDWLKARFGKGQANLLSEQQQLDAEMLLLAKLKGDAPYRALVAEYAKAGRCLGDGEVAS